MLLSDRRSGGTAFRCYVVLRRTSCSEAIARVAPILFAMKLLHRVSFRNLPKGLLVMYQNVALGRVLRLFGNFVRLCSVILPVSLFLYALVDL